MKHTMKLNPTSFEMIKSGAQNFESRLYDEKRKLIELGDEIEFSKLPDLNETVHTIVVGISRAKDFRSLYSFLDPMLAGWEKEDTIDKVISDMHNFYSLEEENKYGVVAIHIKKIE